jgi:hypothetical protein
LLTNALASVNHAGIVQWLSANVVADVRSSVEKSVPGVGSFWGSRTNGHKAYVGIFGNIRLELLVFIRREGDCAWVNKLLKAM